MGRSLAPAVILAYEFGNSPNDRKAWAAGWRLFWVGVGRKGLSSSEWPLCKLAGAAFSRGLQCVRIIALVQEVEHNRPLISHQSIMLRLSERADIMARSSQRPERWKGVRPCARRAAPTARRGHKKLVRRYRRIQVLS